MSEVLIDVHGVAKKFCRSLKRSLWYGMQDLGMELRGRQHGDNGVLRTEEFWAIDAVDLQVTRGECVGLIGRNGAGKTTLLRILNGLIKPDRGRIEIHGRVGALIALGAGFNPILTGRENVYVNASILGLSKRHVDARIDEIIAYAEIGEFSEMPVQHYSSGMTVRLGFAVAAILLEPDVLFLDEVLAVGDVGFTIKSMNTIRELTKNAAVVFVSHHMQSISTFCNRVIVLERGKVLIDTTNVGEGIDRYYSLMPSNIHVSGSGGAEVLSVHLEAEGRVLTGDEPSIPRGHALEAIVRFSVSDVPHGADLMLYIDDESRTQLVCIPIENLDGNMIVFPPGEHCVKLPLGVLDLNAGKYSILIVIRDAKGQQFLRRVQGLAPFRVLSDRVFWGRVIRSSQPSIVESI